jgi:ketosteroid isomerase-like protein
LIPRISALRDLGFVVAKKECLQLCPASFTKNSAFMNRREAIIAGVASIAAAVSGPLAASAQTSAPEDPELEPIRALLDAHDAAFANHDLEGVMACLSEKGIIMGCGPGEIWSGPDEIKAAHLHLFEGFDVGELNIEYEFSIGKVTFDMGWMMTSGNVNGKDGKEFTFPVNISLTVTKDGGKWLIDALHFSTLMSETQEEA